MYIPLPILFYFSFLSSYNVFPIQTYLIFQCYKLFKATKKKKRKETERKNIRKTQRKKKEKRKFFFV